MLAKVKSRQKLVRGHALQVGVQVLQEVACKKSELLFRITPPVLHSPSYGPCKQAASGPPVDPNQRAVLVAFKRQPQDLHICRGFDKTCSLYMDQTRERWKHILTMVIFLLKRLKVWIISLVKFLSIWFISQTMMWNVDLQRYCPGISFMAI